MKHKIIIWHNLNKNTFYAKAVNGYYCNYQLGYINQYNHKIVYIYDINYHPKKNSLIDLVLSPIIAFLKLLTKVLDKITRII